MRSSTSVVFWAGTFGVILPAGCQRAEVPIPPSPPASAAPDAAAKAPALCPPEMAPSGSYCIDRFEASLAVVEGGQRVMWSPYERPLPTATFVAEVRPGATPQAYISREEARAACVGAGKRLCRAREWYAACAGSERRTYPYGSQPEAGRCNVGKPHLLTKLFGRDPSILTYSAHFNSPRVNQEPGFLAPAGGYEGCRTPEGVHDLVGNLHEWVEDSVSARLAQEIPIEYGNEMLGRRGNGVFMGGYFSSHDEHGHGCRYTTTAHAPDYHDYSTGFRCCTDIGASSSAGG